MNFSLFARPAVSRWMLTVLVLVMALSLASCGMFGKKKEKQPNYYAAKEVPELVMPEGLSRPSNATALMIQTPPAPLPEKELQAIPPRVTSQSNSKDENATVRWGSSGIYLQVADTQDSVIRRLNHAAKRSGFNYREQNTGNGLIVRYVHVRSKDPNEGFFSKMAFWRDDGPDYSGEYLITTEADGESTRIYLRNADGSDADQNAAEYLLVKLDERLG
ncbi:MAG: outer membrane protein assembly factor BamC [Xanthomonadales bacterium]|nr:outer membrane protein assembly factor BamC [Xanthomonadales bacterium]